MPRIRFSIVTLMMMTVVASVVASFAARLDSNIREFHRSIELADSDIFDRLHSDSGHLLRSKAAKISIVQIQPTLLDYLFFKRSYCVKFKTATRFGDTACFIPFNNESNFTIDSFRTKLDDYSETNDIPPGRRIPNVFD